MVLSIFTGVFALISGFILSLPFLIDQNVPLDGVKDATDPLKIYLAIIDIILALLNLFGANGDYIIIGNILPAVAMFLAGVGLSNKLLNYINLSSNPEKAKTRKDNLNAFIDKFSILIGLSTFIIGILHFFLWSVVVF